MIHGNLKYSMGIEDVNFSLILLTVWDICNVNQKIKQQMKKLKEKSIEYVKNNYRFQTNAELMKGAGITQSNLAYIFRKYGLKRTKKELWNLRMKPKQIKTNNGEIPHWEKREYKPFEFI